MQASIWLYPLLCTWAACDHDKEGKGIEENPQVVKPLWDKRFSRFIGNVEECWRIPKYPQESVFCGYFLGKQKEGAY